MMPEHPLPPLDPPAPRAAHWLDDPAHVRWLWRGFLVVLAAVAGIEALIDRHPHFEAEAIFAFSAWYGFAACAAMIVFAKGLALLLKRPDRYYHEQGDD